MIAANEFTVKTAAGIVTGPIQVWLTALLNTMTEAQQNAIFEQVQKMKTESIVIVNPDGTTTLVMRGEKGILKSNAGELGS